MTLVRASHVEQPEAPLLQDLFPPHLCVYLAHVKGRRKHLLIDTMAAFTAPCATTNAASGTVARTEWQRQGSGEEAGKSENGVVGQNTILEKTHEFFQMCDIENKGFITRRDMQVRLGGTRATAMTELLK